MAKLPQKLLGMYVYYRTYKTIDGKWLVIRDEDNKTVAGPFYSEGEAEAARRRFTSEVEGFL